MSEIENKAIPFLKPMIMGQPVLLRPRAQRDVATWLALKAIVTRYAHSPVDVVDRDWLDYFYQRHRAPKTWSAWITTYRGSRPYYYEGHDITLSSPDDPANPAVTPHGVLATFVIGYFAAKVLGVRGGTPSDPGPDYMLRVQPGAGANINWPPRLHGDDNTLDAFAKMFLT
jgi:hypothetical protein